MAISLATRQAYTEVNKFLELLPEEQRNIIPKELRNFFKMERDAKYKKEILPNVPIKDQNLKKETLAIIALLNLQYWCKDEEEKKRLKEIYLNNEKKYQEFLQSQFNSNELFEKKETPKNSVSVVETKETFWRKFINKIKNIFSK